MAATKPGPAGGVGAWLRGQLRSGLGRNVAAAVAVAGKTGESESMTELASRPASHDLAKGWRG